MSGQTGVIPTGVYTITNARYHNYLGLTSEQFLAGDTVALGETLIPSKMLWTVTQLANRNYTIHNGSVGLHASIGTRPSAGDTIEAKTSRFQWVVRETGIKGKYVIFSTSTPDLYWGLKDDGLGTQVTMQPVPTNDSNQWIFDLRDVPPDESSTPLQTPVDWLANLGQSRTYGLTDTSIEGFNDAADIVKEKPDVHISRIMGITIQHDAYVLRLRVTYRLSDGSKIIKSHPDNESDGLVRDYIEFSQTEVLAGVSGRLKDGHRVEEISLRIRETLDGKERVVGPFGNLKGVSWAPYSPSGLEFEFLPPGPIIAFGGRCKKKRLKGISFIHHQTYE
ncbi:hypothetical protein BD410DRAFT_494544 [Rickenella mellea]|uniref:Jacalin-type lectin domain-containing protein n=1 Tax=Rickenella mellea TaxID=50990 RepID=A0A4Y7PVQ1_9AGAM|nr:hypothetical protein BD410DRAFT_494544 [Rickenella mellea]